MELTSRELASIIILGAFIASAIVLSRKRNDLGLSFASLLKAATQWKILISITVYVAWAALVVFVAFQLAAWSLALLKDTLIVVFFVGFPLVANASVFKGGPEIVRRVLKEVLGVTALLIVYLNLAPFPLWSELILQSTLLILGLLTMVGASDPKTAGMASCLNVVIGLIVLAVAVYVTVRVIQQFSEYDWTTQWRAFALSVWLPIALIPFVYVFGFLMAYEMALTRLALHNRRQPHRVA